MGTRTSKKIKTLKGLFGLDYVEIKNVPILNHKEFGEIISAKVLSEVGLHVAKKIITEKFHLRGREVEFFRNLFALSKRELAKNLSLSHVSILKWEKAEDKPLDLVNDIAVRVLMISFLHLKINASIENLAPEFNLPAKLVIDYKEIKSNEKIAKRAA